MLINPFTPSEIAANPEDFFGRNHEIKIMERSLAQGSVAIQGTIGIGKSSLLSRTRLIMEGFDSSNNSVSAITTGHKDITNVDEAARLLLESFADVDETTNKVRFNIGNIVEIESTEICRYFATGRHLAGLTRLMVKSYLDMLLTDKEYLILAIDEADKCPIPLARLIRALTTHIQQAGVKRIRFVLAGVSPYFQSMINEDPGLARFFYKALTLLPMSTEEALSLIMTKLKIVIEDAESKRIKLEVHPEVIKRVLALSGGHPHILQLMGSHLIEHENEDPDGLIDSRDLVTSLRAICYEDRAHVYESAIHTLEIHAQIENFKKLIGAAPSSFPTRIERNLARELTGEESLAWFIDNNILTTASDDHYSLVDEFLRIRMIMDEEDSGIENAEQEIISMRSTIKTPFDDITDKRFADYVISHSDDYESSEDDY